MTITLDMTVTCLEDGSFQVVGWQGDDSQESQTVRCIADIAQADPTLTVTKVFAGDPLVTFDYTYTGPGCIASIDGGTSFFLADGDPFQLVDGAAIELFCGLGSHTVTELDSADADFESLVCTPEQAAQGPTVTAQTLSLLVFPVDGSFAGEGECTFTNVVAVDDDDPTLPNISVTKICIEAPADVADFDITIGDQTEAVPCNGTTSLDDVEPGTYEVSEGDNDAVATAIFCGDAAVVVGASTEVTIPDEGAVDVACVIINSFDPDEDALDDLICSCTCCGGLELDIDINNGNTNTIGIDNANLNNNANNNDNANTNDNDNENKNDNKNENTQDQDNTQDQNNTNDQTNNITSSPEVNIDFDE
jgi:hypothetical protein